MFTKVFSRMFKVLRINEDELSKKWYKYSSNPLSVVGLVIVTIAILVAVFANFLSPFPESRYLTDYEYKNIPPSWPYLLGTDYMGRDILSRIIFGARSSLLLSVIVIVIAVPIGTCLGLIAGYLQGTWIDIVIMRTTDVFQALPGTLMALVVSAILGPSLGNMIIAISVFWWPWYARLTYGVASSIKNEFYVVASKLQGASTFHILFAEILPNCISIILTKATLDMGWVILSASLLSFFGLGAQPPKPDLGTMVAYGRFYMPTFWWMTICPALSILVIVLGFNLVGDGLIDLFAVEEF